MLKHIRGTTISDGETLHLHAHGTGDAHFAHFMARRKLGVLLTAVFLTFGFALIEAIAGWLSHSLALISDAGHMVTDAAALGLALMAQLMSTRRPTGRYTFGFGRAEALAAFLNCIIMLAVVGWILIEAISRLNTPRPVQANTVILVATMGLIINICVAWVLARDKNSLNTRAALVHVIGDLLGSLAAITAGIVIKFTGWMQIDPILSILISLLILRSTISILVQSWHFLMKGVPGHIDFGQVGRDLENVNGVLSVHDLHIWEMSPGQVALIGHVEIRRLEYWPEMLQAIRKLLLERYGIEHITLQAESAQSTDVVPTEHP